MKSWKRFRGKYDIGFSIFHLAFVNSDIFFNVYSGNQPAQFGCYLSLYLKAGTRMLLIAALDDRKTLVFCKDN